MAINTTRGLPSFSEMYAAFKNKGSLGDALNAGIEGYKTGDTMRRADLAQQSQSELEKQQAEKAKHDASTPKEPFIRLDQIVDPKEKAELAQYATADEQGILKIPTSTYNAITKRALGAETLDLKNKIAQTEAEKAQALAKAAEEKQALLATLGPQAQSISAAKGLAESTSKVEAPSMAGRLFSAGKEVLTGEPTSAVLAERQGAAARKRLEELQGNAAGATLDAALDIPTTPQKGPGSQAQPIPVNTPEDYANLPLGAWFVDSTGKPTQKRYK